MSLLTLTKVAKSFVQGDNEIDILKDITFNIEKGEVCSLVGPSGCGKSTLLHICGLLETPSGGKLLIDGTDCSEVSDVKATQIRGEKIGFIYQFHHLLPEFNTLENVMMPLLIAGKKRFEAKDLATEILDELSLSHRLTSVPSELSGGEQQRVAIARALINQPKILLADEPTGNLDEKNAEAVFAQFLKIAKNKKVAVLMVTHNLELAKKTDRILTINNGIIDDIAHSKNTNTASGGRGAGTKSKAKKS